jgi:hypothetical protein
LLLCGTPASAQLPGYWEKMYLCDTCDVPILLLSDGPYILSVTQNRVGKKRYYTTFTSIDSGNSWAIRGWNTEYQDPTPTLFHGNNLFSARTTDDRRGNWPTCILQCPDIFTTFNIGLNWDYAEFKGKGIPLMLKMHDPRNGLRIDFTTRTDSTTLYGITVSDSGHTGKLSFTTTYPGRTGGGDAIMSSVDNILVMLNQTEYYVIGKTLDAGRSWKWQRMTPQQGRLYPLVKGHTIDRVLGVRRHASNDLLLSTNGGVIWDTIGANLGRVINAYDPGANRLWMLVARDTIDPTPNPYYQRRTALCDTLYFSSDDGKTWTADDTFAGDSIAMVSWATRDLGYVLGKRDGKTYVARFYPNGFSKVERSTSESLVLSISPNPFTDHVSVTSNNGGEFSFTLMDVLGNQRYSIVAPISGQTRLELPTDLPTGVYFLRAQDPDGFAQTFRLVKQ